MTPKVFVYCSLTAALLANTNLCFAMDPCPEVSEKQLGVPLSLSKPTSPFGAPAEFYEKLHTRYKEGLNYGFMVFCEESLHSHTREERTNFLAAIFKDFPEAPQHFRKFLNDVQSMEARDELNLSFNKALHLNEQEGIKVCLLTDTELAIWNAYRENFDKGLGDLYTYVRQSESNIHSLTSLLSEVFKDCPTAVQHFEKTVNYNCGFFQPYSIKLSFLRALQINRQKGISPQVDLETIIELSGKYWESIGWPSDDVTKADKKAFLKEAMWYSILGAKEGDKNAFSRLEDLINGYNITHQIIDGSPRLDKPPMSKKKYRLFFAYFIPFLAKNDPQAQKLFEKVCSASPEAFEWIKKYAQKHKDKPGLSACLNQAIDKYSKNECDKAMNLLTSNPQEGIQKLFELERHHQKAKEELDVLRASEGYKNPKKAPSNDLGALLKKLDLRKAEDRYMQYISFTAGARRGIGEYDSTDIDDAVGNLYNAAQMGFQPATKAKMITKRSEGYMNAQKTQGQNTTTKLIDELGKRCWLYEQKPLETKTIPPVQSITPSAAKNPSVAKTAASKPKPLSKKQREKLKKRETEAQNKSQKQKETSPPKLDNKLAPETGSAQAIPTSLLGTIDQTPKIIIPVDEFGNPKEGFSLPPSHGLEPEEKKEEVARTTEVPIFTVVPDLAAVPRSSENLSSPKAKKESKVKKVTKTLDKKTKQAKHLLNGAIFLKESATSKNSQAFPNSKAGKNLFKTAQTIKTIKHAEPRKELELPDTTERPDSEKPLKRQNSTKSQNSTKKQEHRDSLKTLERRNSKKELERRDSEKKQERLEASQQTRVIEPITPAQRDLLFWLTMDDAKVVTNKATVKKVVKLLKALGCTEETAPGGSGHKKAVAPNIGGGSWTIPTDVEQLVRSYRRELQTFILEGMKIDPPTVPVKG